MGNRDGDKNFSAFLNKNKKIIGVASIAVIAIGVGGSIYTYNLGKKVAVWEDKVYPGVYMQGVDLSGKTRDEVQVALADTLNKKIEGKEIVINAGEKSYKGNYGDVGGKYNIEKATEDAINYEKDSSVFKKNSIIKGNKKANLEVEFIYDNNKLKDFKKKAEEKLNVKAKNAKLQIVGSERQITKEQNGNKLDVEDLDKNLIKNLNGNLEENTTVEAKYVEDKPKVTEEELKKITGVLGSFESSFASSTPGRAANIIAAVGFVDGTLLMPGEEFSYDKATSTDKSKYHQAPVYINNKIEMDIGGGICQVSSALYRAMMHANVRPTERHNHSMTVSYAKPSLDATVAWGYLDYKFKNPYDFPIYIKGTSNGRNIRFEVHGDPRGLDGKSYKMENEIIKTIPQKEKIVKDPTLEEGKRVVESEGQIGYVSKGYQLTYKDGKLINKELVSTDTYATNDRVVKVGTKKTVVAPPTTQEPPKVEEQEVPKA